MIKLTLNAFMLLSMMIIVSLEVYQITKMSDILASVFINNATDHKNETIQKNQTVPKYYCKASYTWCFNNCVRFISRRYGTIKEYDACKHMCEGVYGVHSKKLII